MENSPAGNIRPWAIPRKYPRVPLKVRVEKLAGGRTTRGRAGDVSLGGILVLLVDTLEPGSEVRVRFTLPSGHHIDVGGEVVHATPGARMGIKFSTLNPDDIKALAEYVEQIRPYKRRGQRIVRRLRLYWRWQDYDCNWHEEVAQTVVLSRYGGLIRASIRMKAGQTAYVFWPDRDREAEVRVVFLQITGPGNPSEIGFEFVTTDNFWEMDFPPDVPVWELKGR